MLPQLLNETHFTLIDEYRKSTDRKPLNKNSMKQFIANYNILSRKMNKDNYLEDFDGVMSHIDDDEVKNSTQRNYLNSIITWAQVDNINKEITDKYIVERNKRNNIYNEEQATGKMGEDDVFVTKEELLDMFKIINKQLVGNDIFKKNWDIIENNDKDLYTYYMMMNLYMIHPLRNDYGEMIRLTKKQFEMLSDEEKSMKNYLLKSDRYYMLAIGDYKTNINKETKMIDIVDKPFLTLLRKFLKVKGQSEYLFDLKSQPFTKNQVTKFLQKFSKKYLGKPVSSRSLRKSFYTETYGNGDVDLQQLKKDANNNLHSVGTAIGIYTKTNQIELQTVAQEVPDETPPLL
tara:strand:- start:345 stop:1382 length:1038 start_codon:yes stop_codon:yes gene_type:complete